MTNYLETLKKDIKCLEKLADRLEVLDILKNKHVDLSWFVWTGNADAYNRRFELSQNHLTEEEYIKIKEWLEDE